MNTRNLDKNFLISEYETFKRKAFGFYKKNQFEHCLECIQFCGQIAWNYPILYNFCDDELEELMAQIKKKLKVSGLNHQNKNEKTIIFYNSQIVNSGGLTEQYLNYFIEKKYKILFIVPDNKNTKLGSDIIQTIRSNQNIELFIPRSRKAIKKIKEINEVVRNSEASYAFLHFIPNDVVGYTVFSDLTDRKRYYIVHNDHTFWFGKGCSDYFLEFRKFGYLLSTKRRLIDSNKIYLLPYYPIIQKTEFQGFPFNPKGKIIGFSGANLYKYYLDPELKFFKAIKTLIDNNPNFIFCLAGAGDQTIIRNFIIQNRLQEKFFLLGKRNDFYALIGNIDILFDSYPLKGGLTVLYAVENKKAITGIANDDNASGSFEDFFELKDYRQPQNISDFLAEADKLIKDKQFRTENAAMFRSSKYKRHIFNRTLLKIIERKEKQIGYSHHEKLKLNDDYYLSEYLNLPNAEFIFSQTKLFALKSIIPFRERLSILKRIISQNPQNAEKRIFRKIFLVVAGK